METKTIPFNIEIAKAIQAGDIKGRIKTIEGKSVRIICWDKKSVFNNITIVALIDCGQIEELYFYTEMGEHGIDPCPMLDLVLEVPDNEPKEPQFKPFDKVLVKDDEFGWIPTLYSFFTHKATHITINGEWDECLPYEGNQELVGTINKPE